MKKILGILFALMLIPSLAGAVDEFIATEPAGTRLLSEIDDYIEDNNNALVRLLAHARRGAGLVYESASVLTVEAGEVTCANSAGTTLHMRINTSDITGITWSDLDTGSEANSTTYYVYGVGDADTATFTVKLSVSATSPTGVTYYKKLGSFYNNSSGDIEQINNLLPSTSVVDSAITQAKLSTTTVEVSSSTENVHLTLPGGTYGFYPQVKVSSALDGGNILFARQGTALTTSYVTNIAFSLAGGGPTYYVQQRYVTASGTDFWLFLLTDKTTKEIISAWAAPDHPSYGNGGDPAKVPHPFNSYDSSEHKIILIEKENTEVLRQEAKDKEVSLLTLINEDYKVDFSTVEDYVPLHSGKFLGKARVLIQDIPDYIKVNKLKPLTDPEKVARENRHDANRAAREQKELKLKNDKENAKQKLETLGLTLDELEAIGIK